MSKIVNISSAGKTDIGLKRKNNEDLYLIVESGEDGHDIENFGKMFVVADGMGGHMAGETASRMACEGLLDYYKYPGDENPLSPEDLLIRLEDIIHTTSNSISKFAYENREYTGMGTTLSVLVLHKGNALIAHVGDSRIYRLRGNELEQLTTDHTQVQELVNIGRLTRKEAASHHLRHILSQVVGMEKGLNKVYKCMEQVQKGDIFLLCSDGLYDMMSDEEIKTILLEGSSPERICDKLVKGALEHAGKDNVTMVVVFCE